MAFEHPRWPERDDDDDDPPLTERDDDVWHDRGWTAESRCPECEYTKGHAPGCPNE